VKKLPKFDEINESQRVDEAGYLDDIETKIVAKIVNAINQGIRELNKKALDKLAAAFATTLGDNISDKAIKLYNLDFYKKGMLRNKLMELNDNLVNYNKYLYRKDDKADVFMDNYKLLVSGVENLRLRRLLPELGHWDSKYFSKDSNMVIVNSATVAASDMESVVDSLVSHFVSNRLTVNLASNQLDNRNINGGPIKVKIMANHNKNGTAYIEFSFFLK